MSMAFLLGFRVQQEAYIQFCDILILFKVSLWKNLSYFKISSAWELYAKVLTLHLRIACQEWQWPTWSEVQDARSRKLEAFLCIQVEAPHKSSSRLTSLGCCHLTAQCCECTKWRMDPLAIQFGACRTHISSDVHHQLLELEVHIPK